MRLCHRRLLHLRAARGEEQVRHGAHSGRISRAARYNAVASVIKMIGICIDLGDPGCRNTTERDPGRRRGDRRGGGHAGAAVRRPHHRLRGRRTLRLWVPLHHGETSAA